MIVDVTVTITVMTFSEEEATEWVMEVLEKEFLKARTEPEGPRRKVDCLIIGWTEPSATVITDFTRAYREMLESNSESDGAPF